MESSNICRSPIFNKSCLDVCLVLQRKNYRPEEMSKSERTKRRILRPKMYMTSEAQTFKEISMAMLKQLDEPGVKHLTKLFNCTRHFSTHISSGFNKNRPCQRTVILLLYFLKAFYALYYVILFKEIEYWIEKREVEYPYSDTWSFLKTADIAGTV